MAPVPELNDPPARRTRVARFRCCMYRSRRAYILTGGRAHRMRVGRGRVPLSERLYGLPPVCPASHPPRGAVCCCHFSITRSVSLRRCRWPGVAWTHVDQAMEKWRSGMTTDDWVALAMIWWHGRGRTVIARWLSDPAGAVRTREQPLVSLDSALADIDPRLSAPHRVALARGAATEGCKRPTGPIWT